MMAAAAALEGDGSPTKEELNVPPAVQPRKGASTGTNSTLLHDSALRTATNTTAASTPIIPASVEASLHSLLSTPTGTKLAVTTPSDSPAGGEGARITLDEEKKIALSQLQELEVAIEVRKVTKVDGRKIRWIEYRARKKAEEEKQAAVTKRRPRRSKSKSKGGENSENDANVVNNNNNNSKSENTMKVETAVTPLSVVGTSNVLESMKQQFLQGTENIEEPVTNGKTSLLSETNVTVQKRKSGRTRRSVSTPEGGTPNNNTPKKSSPNESNVTGTYLRSGLAPKGTTPASCSITNTSVSLPNTPFTPDQPLSLALKKNFFSPKSLTKGLREVRKVENGVVGDNTPKSDDVKVPVSSPVTSLSLTTLTPIVAEDVKTETKTSSSPAIVSTRSVSPTSTRSKSVDNVSTKGKKGGNLKGSNKKVSAKAGGRSESEPRNILNGHTVVLQNGSVEEKGPPSTEETSPTSEPATPDKNASNKKSSSSGVDPDSPIKRPRGRPPKRRPEINKDSNTTSPGKSSKKLETVVVDVHNTMNGEPQTVIPVSKPVLRGKRTSPHKKSSPTAATVLPGASDEANTKDLFHASKQPRTGEIKSNVENKNPEKALQSVLPVHDSKKGKAVTGKKDGVAVRKDREENENSSASICNQTPLSPDKTHSTKLVKGVQKPTHQEVPSESECENTTAISSSLTSVKEQKALKSSPKLKAVPTKRKENSQDSEKAVIGKDTSTVGVSRTVESTQAQKSKAVLKCVNSREGKINSTQASKSKAVLKYICAQKGKYAPKDIFEENTDSVDVSAQKGSKLRKVSSSEIAVSVHIGSTLQKAAATEKEISPQRRSTLPKIDSIEDISPQESTPLPKDVCTHVTVSLPKANFAKHMFMQDDNTLLKVDSAAMGTITQESSILPKAELTEKATTEQKSRISSSEKDASTQKSSTLQKDDSTEIGISSQESSAVPKTNLVEKGISTQKNSTLLNTDSTEKDISAEKGISTPESSNLLKFTSSEKPVSLQKSNSLTKGNCTEKNISVGKSDPLSKPNVSEKSFSTQKSDILPKSNSTENVPTESCALSKANSTEKTVPSQKSSTLPKFSSVEVDISTEKSSTLLKADALEKEISTQGSHTLPKADVKDVSLQKSNASLKADSTEKHISNHKINSLPKTDSTERSLYTSLKAHYTKEDISTQESNTLPKTSTAEKSLPKQKSNCLSKLDSSEEEIFTQRGNILPKDNSRENDSISSSTLLEVSSKGKGICTQKKSTLLKTDSTEKDTSISVKKGSTLLKANFVEKDETALKGSTSPKVILSNNSGFHQKGSIILKEIQAEKGVKGNSVQKDVAQASDHFNCDNRVLDYSVEKQNQSLTDTKIHKESLDIKGKPFQRGNVASKDKLAHKDVAAQNSCPAQDHEIHVNGPTQKGLVSVKERFDYYQSRSQADRQAQKGSVPEKSSSVHQVRLSKKNILVEKDSSLQKGSPLRKSIPISNTVSAHIDAITLIDTRIPLKNLVQRGVTLHGVNKKKEGKPAADSQRAKEVNQPVPVSEVINVYDCEEKKIDQKDIVKDTIGQNKMVKESFKVGKDARTPEDPEVVVVNQVHKIGRAQENNEEIGNDIKVITQTLKDKGKKQVSIVPKNSDEQDSRQKHAILKNDATNMKSVKDVETYCTQAQVRLEKQGQANDKEGNHAHKANRISKASEEVAIISSTEVTGMKKICKVEEKNEMGVSQELEAEAEPSSAAASLSVQSSSTSKSKEKVPRILKQLLQDEGVQNILKSMGEESGTAPETSPNNDPGAHKLRPKRAAEPMLSSSPELDAIEALITSSTKKKKRGTELDTLYMDEGVLNLLTSLEPHSRRSQQDDAGSDVSQASSSRSVRGNKSSKSSLELHSESRKRKLSGASTVSNTSTRSVQAPDSKRSRLEGQEPSEDPYELDSVDELQEEPAIVKRDTSVVDMIQAKKKGKITIPLAVRQKSKTIRIQLKPQKQKEMNSMINNSQVKEDECMNLADLQDVLRRAKEKFNETPLQATTIEESSKSVPPLKIKLASDSVTIKSVAKPSPLQQPAAVSEAGKPASLLTKQNVQNLNEESRRHNSRPPSAPLESRVSVRSTLEKPMSYQEKCAPVLQFRRLDTIASSSAASFTSLVRTIDGSGQQKSRQRIGGESLRQSQRASVRQSESNYHYRDISLRKFNNFTQIILSPSTTKMKNALNSRVLRELCEALNLLKRDESVRMVLLTATGSTFCQGVDLTALQHPNIDTRKKNAENLVRGIKDFLKALVQFPKPIVAGVNGNAMGLGVTMLPLFDLVIANDKAEFYLPYAKLGQVPEGGATYTFPYLFGKLPSTKLFLGHKLTASKAEEMGLASESIWPATYQQELIPKVALLATQSAQSMEATKALMNHHLVTKLELSLESECRLLLQQWTSPHFAHMCKRFLDSHYVHLQKPVNMPL